MFRHVAAVTLTSGVLLGFTASAHADPPADAAAAALRADSVYVDPASGRQLDAGAVRAAIGQEPIKIAVLPSGPAVGEVAALPRELSRSLPGYTIAVIRGRYFYAGSEVLCEGAAGKATSDSIADNNAFLDADDNSDLTKPLIDFVGRVRAAPHCPAQQGRLDRYADPAGKGATGVDDTTSVLPFVACGVGLGVLAVGALVFASRRRTRGAVLDHREQAAGLVARLAQELAATPDEDGHAHHGEAQALLLGATTDAQFAHAANTAIAGLVAVRDARVAAGGPVGDPIPEPVDGEPEPTAARVSSEDPTT